MYIVGMEDKKLIQYLELMKKDIYVLSNKVSQISSEIKSTDTQEVLQIAKLDRIEKNQEKIINSINTLNSRLINLESAQMNNEERVEDIHTEFITFKNALGKKTNSSSVSNVKKPTSEVGEELFDKISNVEEHFSSEIAKVYDKMFNEILDLKSEIEKIK